MARPAKAQNSINKDELEELMEFFPSKEETSSWFRVSESSLLRFIKHNYKESFDTFRDKRIAKTKIGIRRAQIKKALSGDNTMLIWCGKQYLGQVDSPLNPVSDEVYTEPTTLAKPKAD